MFETIACIWRGKCQHPGYGKRQGRTEKIRPVHAPSGSGPVGNHSHYRVENGVIKLGYQQKCSCMGKRQPEHIRIEERQVVGENLPEHRR